MKTISAHTSPFESQIRPGLFPSLQKVLSKPNKRNKDTDMRTRIAIQKNHGKSSKS